MVSAIQVSPLQQNPVPQQNAVRVNAGGSASTDSSGAAWSADCCNSGGSVATTSANVAGTADPQLYRTLRWSSSPFTYTFSGLAAGTYQVTLKFAEISGLGPGRRQFNVAINGSQVLTNLDVAAQVGLNTALDKTLSATVGSTGQLTVTFARGAADNPMVSAIQVVQTGPPPSTTTPTSTVDPSGQTMPVGDVPGWHQVFADDFSNDNVPRGSFSGCSETGTPVTSHCTGLPTAVDSKWWAYPDGWSGTPATAVNYPSKVLSIQNGLMTYYIHTESLNGSAVHMVAAPLPKIPGATGSWGGMQYGRYVFRARMDPLYGYHASFLLWPDDNVWPRDGEIDWPEADLDSPTISGFMHWQNATAGSQQDAYNVMDPFDQWHTYEIDWTSTNCSFYIDGNLVGSSTDPTKIPATPMHLVLQIAASFSETAAPTTAGNVQIDWLTVYRPA
jgi:Malectin domain/Glycosyl hydrolases family 16